ncbi:sigma factor-like helix-turn-helix DNA-binding protein [Streptomyces sp. NPDC052107]|uniref:sigma factor-like helix-turn-helix DNA-binding protein n=1 Tax=Streptomyces sp. NPDC052107 TaxID=3155632 RepID=UPI00343D1224
MTPQNTAGQLPPPTERRRLRQSRSLTHAQLAAQVGIGPSTLCAWESGRLVPHGSEGETYTRLLTTFALQDVVEGTTAVEGSTTIDGSPVVDGATAAEAGRETPPAVIPDPLTPAQAFDALYAFCAPALVRQTYLLTGRRELAREAVERAFQLAWQRWPEVARDRDPGGWVRAVAHDYALSPWHGFRPRYRHPEPPSADPADRALLGALLTLPPAYRRTLVLYDGVGLDLPETAAETEASTPAAANRLTHAREALAAQVPALADPAELHSRLRAPASNEGLRAADPEPVRRAGERRNAFWTRAAIAFTVTIIGATALTMRSAPTHYEAPIAPAQAVQGVPPVGVMGPLSREEQALRAKLRGAAAKGPDRLVPEAR